MQEDLDLERVVNDPDYRRKAIQDLNRAEERLEDDTAQQHRNHVHDAGDAKGNAA